MDKSKIVAGLVLLVVFVGLCLIGLGVGFLVSDRIYPTEARTVSFQFNHSLPDSEKTPEWIKNNSIPGHRPIEAFVDMTLRYPNPLVPDSDITIESVSMNVFIYLPSDDGGVRYLKTVKNSTLYFGAGGDTWGYRRALIELHHAGPPYSEGIVWSSGTPYTINVTAPGPSNVYSFGAYLYLDELGGSRDVVKFEPVVFKIQGAGVAEKISFEANKWFIRLAFLTVVAGAPAVVAAGVPAVKPSIVWAMKLIGKRRKPPAPPPSKVLPSPTPIPAGGTSRTHLNMCLSENHVVDREPEPTRNWAKGCDSGTLSIRWNSVI